MLQDENNRFYELSIKKEKYFLLNIMIYDHN